MPENPTPAEIIAGCECELRSWFNQHGGYHENAERGMCGDEAAELLRQLADDVERHFAVRRGPWVTPGPGDVMRHVTEPGPSVEVLEGDDDTVRYRTTLTNGTSSEGSLPRLGWIRHAARVMDSGGFQYTRAEVPAAVEVSA